MHSHLTLPVSVLKGQLKMSLDCDLALASPLNISSFRDEAYQCRVSACMFVMKTSLPYSGNNSHYADMGYFKKLGNAVIITHTIT